MRAIFTLLLMLVSVVFLGLLSGRSQHNPINQQIAQNPAPQIRSSKKYMDEGVVDHKPGLASLRANDPRPLKQAIEALNNEYGWMVDYEDPPYMSDLDLIDITDSRRRAANPNVRATVPAGDSFQVDFSEDSSVTTPRGEEAILRIVATAYNQSGNPGKFIVRSQGRNRYTLIGTSAKNQSGHDQAVRPILDTLISLPLQERSVMDTLRAICEELSTKSGTKVALGGFLPLNFFAKARARIGGENVPARTLLIQTFNSTDVALVYGLLYFEDTQRYILTTHVAGRMLRDSFGKKQFIQMTLPPGSN